MQLAELSKLEYATVRKEAAEKVGIRATDLDKFVEEARAERAKNVAEPETPAWPEEVDGVALLDDIVATIRRHLILKPSKILTSRRVPFGETDPSIRLE